MDAFIGVIPELHEVTAVREVIAGDRLAVLNQSNRQQIRESVKKAIEMIKKRLDNNKSVFLTSAIDSPTITEALTAAIKKSLDSARHLEDVAFDQKVMRHTDMKAPMRANIASMALEEKPVRDAYYEMCNAEEIIIKAAATGPVGSGRDLTIPIMRPKKSDVSLDAAKKMMKTLTGNEDEDDEDLERVTKSKIKYTQQIHRQRLDMLVEDHGLPLEDMPSARSVNPIMQQIDQCNFFPIQLCYQNKYRKEEISYPIKSKEFATMVTINTKEIFRQQLRLYGLSLAATGLINKAEYAMFIRAITEELEDVHKVDTMLQTAASVMTSVFYEIQMSCISLNLHDEKDIDLKTVAIRNAFAMCWTKEAFSKHIEKARRRTDHTYDVRNKPFVAPESYSEHHSPHGKGPNRSDNTGTSRATRRQAAKNRKANHPVTKSNDKDVARAQNTIQQLKAANANLKNLKVKADKGGKDKGKGGKDKGKGKGGKDKGKGKGAKGEKGGKGNNSGFRCEQHQLGNCWRGDACWHLHDNQAPRNPRYGPPEPVTGTDTTARS